MVIIQLWFHEIQMYSYPPLWKRGARGDFLDIIIKSPLIPLCQRGTKALVTEWLQSVSIQKYRGKISVSEKSCKVMR